LGDADGRWSLSGALARWVRSPVPLVAPRGGGNFIAARLVGEAIAAALERGDAGTRYLLGDENLTWAEVLARFAVGAGRPRQVRIVPDALFVAALAVAGGLARVAGRRSGMHVSGFARLLTEELYFDAKPARHALFGAPD